MALSVPLRGELALDSSGNATFAGKWAMTLDDLNSEDDHKRSPFEYKGVPTPTQPPTTQTTASSKSATSSVTANTVDTTSSMTVTTDTSSTTNLQQASVTINGIPFPTKWKGVIKTKTGVKLETILENVDMFQLTPDADQPNMYKILFAGDNRVGKFEAKGALTMNLETMKGDIELMKTYTVLWDKKNKRPTRKRAPSSSMTEEEREEAKRRKIEKIKNNLFVGASGAAVAGRQSARTRVKPAQYRADPAMELPHGLNQWVVDCYTILSSIREYDATQHKSYGGELVGMLFRPVPTEGWLGCEKYLPTLKEGNTYPIDLGEIQRRLKAGDFYESHHSYAADVRRVFHNAFLFNPNPKTAVSIIATRLSKKFEDLYKPLITKEMKEIKQKLDAERKKREQKLLKEKQKKEKQEKRRLAEKKRKQQKALKKLQQRKQQQQPKSKKTKRTKKINYDSKSDADKDTIAVLKQQNERQLQMMQQMMQQFQNQMGAGVPQPQFTDVEHFIHPDVFDRRSGGGGAPKRTKPKKQKRKVSAKARELCHRHLNQVAQAYMDEFGRLCNELNLVNKKTGSAEFDIHELEDEKAKRLVQFVKTKMKLIIKKGNEEESQTGRKQHVAKEHQEQELYVDHKVDSDPDSGDDMAPPPEDDFDPFALPPSGSFNDPPSGVAVASLSGSFDASQSSSWQTAQKMQNQSDISANNMANAVNDVNERQRVDYERNAREVKERDEQMVREKQAMEDQKRQQEAADEMRREEDRRAQVIEREQEAARETFDNHEEEESYDPYAMDF